MFETVVNRYQDDGGVQRVLAAFRIELLRVLEPPVPRRFLRRGNSTG